MAFATIDDITARRALTESETTQAEALLDAATGVITVAAGKTDAWAADYEAPAIIRFLTVEIVLRMLANPTGVASVSEALGAYQHTERFRDNGGGLLLSPSEELLVSRAVHGTTSGSARLDSTLTDIFDMTYGS